jgi:hypothetical protein
MCCSLECAAYVCRFIRSAEMLPVNRGVHVFPNAPLPVLCTRMALHARTANLLPTHYCLITGYLSLWFA